MKKIIVLLILAVSQLLASVNAQTTSKTEVVTVDGQQYILYQVKAGETIFSICKHFQIEQKELVSANPQLIFGMKQGDTLKIPVPELPSSNDDNSVTTITQRKDDRFLYHVVKKSETIYSISRDYGVSIQNLYRFNPEAEGELLENEIIRIPNNVNEEKLDGFLREDDAFYYHKIQPKENAYSLSRRYHASVSSIFKYNPVLEDNFEIGRIVRIPRFEDKVEAESVDESGEFFWHRVESGDTFYAYQRRFGVSKELLIELNPVLNEGLLAGLEIRIPSTKIKKVEVIPVDPDRFIEHIVEKGETLYSLSKTYQVKILELKEWNPELKVRGLIAGETIYIQKPQTEPEMVSEVIPSTDTPQVTEENIDNTNEQEELPALIFNVVETEDPVCKNEFERIEDDTFRISMFLPLFFDKNDTFNLEKKSDKEIAYLDSMKYVDPLFLEKYFRIETDTLGEIIDTILVDSLKVKEFRALYPPSRTFFPFYQGALLAIDSMQKAGLNIRLDLYDSQFSKSVVDSILYTHDFINSDLIVGPMNVKAQEAVSAFSAKNEIPMVSPIYQDDDFTLKNPFYFQVRPTKDYLLRKTAEYIGDEYYNKNFVVMTLGSYTKLKEGDLVNLIREKFFSKGLLEQRDEINFTEVDFTEGENMGYWQVKKTLKPNVENVIFIPTTDDRKVREPLLSIAINSLSVLAEDFDITLIGVSDYPQFRSIETAYFHKLNLHYLASTYIDYGNPDVCDFIGKYRSNFNNEPDRMSFMGYDIVAYFSSAYMNLGKQFTECVSSYHTPLLQNDFNFQRVNDLSGYMNHTLFIMNYSADFEVKKITTVTEGF